MGRIYRYEGEYGILEVDIQNINVITDELDRVKIWKDAGEDYWEQHRIYAEIIEELFGEDIAEIFPPRRNKNEYWCGAPTDFGFKAFSDEDGIEVIIDAEGTFIIHEPKGRRAASYRF